MQSTSVNTQRSSELDHRQLLINLKKSIELWFLVRRDCSEGSVNTTETIIQIQIAIKAILTDGHLLQGTTLGYRKLIIDLNWLNTPALLNQQSERHAITPLEKADDLSKWIYFCLKNGGLCESLQHFVADQELLESYYNSSAYLRNERYATALFICLSAFELNQSSLISQIDPSLYTGNSLERLKHKRSSSHPNFSISPKKYSICCKSAEKKFGNLRSTYSTEIYPVEANKNFYKGSNQRVIYKRSKSLPYIAINTLQTRKRSKTISQPVSIPKRVMHLGSVLEAENQDLSNFVYQQYCNESGSSGTRNIEASSDITPDLSDLVPIQLVKCDDIKIYVDQTQIPTEVNIPHSYSDGAIEYDSPPQSKGVSSINLLSCISSNIFSPSYENLSKDQNILQSAFSSSAPSDFVSGFLAQQGEKIKSRFANSVFEDITDDQLLENNNSECPSTPLASQSLASFLQSASFSRNNTDLERENAHFKISEAIISIIEQLKSSKLGQENNFHKDEEGCSSNLEKSKTGSIYSVGNCSILAKGDNASDGFGNKTTQNANDYIAYAEWGENNLDALSAEGVALSLISKFRDKELPLATDLKWLVSEEDAPQKLLPMPTSFSCNPDENIVHSFTRGTRDWAPPRQQVIFTDHPLPNRKRQMQKQNHRCAGCGMKVAIMYISRYRYCTYFGKYHCSGCHRNQIALIPAKVITKWDFTYYPVSVFAYRLLEQILSYPLFYIPDLNATLYSKIKSLHMAKLRRIQLKYVQDFIKTCRFAEKEKTYFNSIPSYWCSDPDKWSMSDFIAAKNGSLQKTLGNLIEKCEEHVFNCVLCTAHGFICELCPRKQIIYPWQVKVKRCENCGTCFHLRCWKNIPDCVKCQRLRMRQQRMF